MAIIEEVQPREKDKKFYLYQKKFLPKFVELINHLAIKFPKKKFVFVHTQLKMLIFGKTI